ncbi:Uncharacterised protein [Bordetella pertussis]|nr:Uncharacterised protein [Bordetella pertussis]
MRRPRVPARSSKSRSVQRWMLGVLYHWYGIWPVTGMRPRRIDQPCGQ